MSVLYFLCQLAKRFLVTPYPRVDIWDFTFTFNDTSVAFAGVYSVGVPRSADVYEFCKRRSISLSSEMLLLGGGLVEAIRGPRATASRPSPAPVMTHRSSGVMPTDFAAARAHHDSVERQ
ncbi:hypothetical protein OF83DRAFT_609586 [Amylostereum chailletii]|nr:hypothetical protein OF83DRAFT_609586 [Amylostereum chailletii]